MFYYNISGILGLEILSFKLFFFWLGKKIIALDPNILCLGSCNRGQSIIFPAAAAAAAVLSPTTGSIRS